MIHNTELRTKIKKISWNQRQQFLSETDNDGKFLSTYKIWQQLEQPKDWHSIAQRCSENPTHEMYGVPAEQILERWRTKSSTGANRGNVLDDYITAKLQNASLDISHIDDQNLLKKLEYVDSCYANVLSKLHSYVGSELWLNSSKLGVSVRCDSMFTSTDNMNCFIPDWKNNNSMSTSNRWQKLRGPASHLEQTDWVKYTFQLQIYKYIVEDYEIFDTVSAKIINFTQDGTKWLDFAFPYDKRFIEEVVQFSKEQIQIDTIKNS